MSRRFPRHHREPDVVHVADMPGLLLAFGIALLLGLVSGVGWIVWNLVRIHVLGGQP